MGWRPPRGAVRIEELVNYFSYDYPSPDAGTPFSASIETAACPWALDHRLVRIGLKGREIPPDKRVCFACGMLVEKNAKFCPYCGDKLP